MSEKEAIKKGQYNEDGFVFQQLSLKYPNYDHFIQSSVNINISKNDFKKVTSNVVPVEETSQSVQEIELDSMATLKQRSTKKLDVKHIDTTLITRIQYPHSASSFVSELYEKLTSSRCRIIHYGDSQLEGDRITSYLRNRLQTTFGGNGPGFLPVMPVYNQSSAIIEPDEHWLRYARFDPAQPKFNHKKYGAYLSVSRFTPYFQEVDSLTLDSLPVVKASLTIRKSNHTYTTSKRFTKIGLHYGHAKAPVHIFVFNDEQLIQQDTLYADGNYHKYAINTSVTPTNLRIELEGKISPDFYGLTLDGWRGVQMDNVAMRGSSGTIFASTNAANYSHMVNILQPKIVMMQYGGNTVPYLKDSVAVRKYAKYVVSQVAWMRRRTTENPSFVFIGPSDMSTSINGKMTTYPLLPYLNNTLQTTCLENNIAYWSMYDAMGGEGSMSYWVDQKLAGKDYTHFTRSGTKIISELFFTALYLDLKQNSPNEL
ncbi:lipase [Aquimarina sp. ERC-38]|uniref:lipase n=1 Tax=Aquimarina sp. ERC-38 TaxID=2949996 RepID=UPI0022486C6A|nr:lipase [Aquimarina sp. ERC-38]UZO82587.1 lipase [Aquimarina sp. ERC-38]